MAVADGDPVTEIVYVDTSGPDGVVRDSEFLVGEAPEIGVEITPKSEYYG